MRVASDADPIPAVEERSVELETIERLGSWDEVMAGHADEVVTLASALRTLVIENDPDVVEVPRAGEGSVAYGVGEKKMSEAYCYLMPQRDRVNVGFYHGVDVPDPDGLLEGSGARLRHVKVYPGAGGPQPPLEVLHRLIAASRTQRIAALEG